MLIYLTHTTGIRVTELALLEVGDVLYPSGAIRPEVYLRAEITKGCRPRNIYLTQPRCLASIEQWIAVRLRRGWGVSSEIEYGGLRPDSRLVMTHKGQAFELAFKHRELECGPEVYRACDAWYHLTLPTLTLPNRP
ncbi:integrase [Pseudomonas aeruginosa]|nr:integrase [Pseudomonas aeruginosa]